MKYVIHKGIAGLGNHFQGLGWALDLAIEHSAKLCVDWSYFTWRLGFGRYFTLDGIDVVGCDDIRDTGSISPEVWRGRLWDEIRGSKDTLITRKPDLAAGTVVVCAYKAKHTDELYRRIQPTAEAEENIRAVIDSEALEPGGYDCWHIRHTDKTTEGWPSFIRQAADAQRTTGTRSVIVTDSLAVQAEALSFGLSCPSSICEPLRNAGVHHAAIGDGDKHRINLSAISDMYIAIGARQFVACSPSSTYAWFIERMRRVAGVQIGRGTPSTKSDC